MVSADLTAPAGSRRLLGSPRRMQLAALVVVLAAWELTSISGLIYRGVLPSWLEIGAALFRLLGTAAFWSNGAVTLFEIGVALVVGCTIGTVTGLIVGSNRLLAASVEPLINCIASTPKVIFLPILYLAFGIGVGSKIAAGSLGCFFPMVIGVTAAMLNMNPTLIRVGRSFGLPWWQMVWKIYFPSLVEPIGNGLRIAVGVAIGVCLIAETRFSYAGLGYMVIDSFNRSRFAQVYAILIVIIALAVAANALVMRIGAGRGSRRSS
jgi:ABC-type nitrate/sulfonate/bicarbonate transport system permease component